MTARMSRWPVLALVFLLALAARPAPVSATWSIIAVDTRTGLVVIASATCVTAEGLRTRGGLMSIQAIIVPVSGWPPRRRALMAPARIRCSSSNRCGRGWTPDDILQMLSQDPDFERRQFGIVDLQGRMAGFSGSRNGYASLAVQTEVRDEDIYFAVQGNILENDDVVLNAVRAMLAEEGSVLDRVMVGMEAASAAGGDARCSCRSQPVPETDAGCRHRSAHVAYIAAARPEDPTGEGHSDGDYSLFIDVDDENTTAREDASPVATLRQRFDAWKADGGLARLERGLDVDEDPVP